ncbi:MAG: protein phosphatase CheZ [Rhodospirillales bacterium]|jgi:chemotaxis protein CheZ|nr:protein phosphatase CheZ [Rhodospirillales bacterium]
MLKEPDADVLKREFVRLFGHIQKIRQELAALGPASADEDHFGGMADQLDAIVEATEEATNTIMGAMESMENNLSSLKGMVAGEEAHRLVAGTEDEIGKVYEACSFQDITGQRITKVVKSMKFIEERITSMLGMWRADELKQVAGDVKKELTEEQKLLNGPQLKGQGIKQDDVDKLFSQDDIDKLFG